MPDLLLRFLKVQAAFDRERSSENYFSGGFEITGDMRISLGYDPGYACYTLILKFASLSGRMCGAATHAVDGDVDYDLRRRNTRFEVDTIYFQVAFAEAA